MKENTKNTLAALAAFSLLSLGVAGCREEREQTVGAEVRPPAAEFPAAVTGAELVDKPDQFKGQRVMLSGEVNQIFGPRIFTIGGDEFGSEVLVVAAEALPPVMGRDPAENLSRDDIILATGTVRSFNLAEIEKSLKLDLKNELVAPFVNKSYIDASKVVITPRTKRTGEAVVLVPMAEVTIIAAPKKEDLIGKQVRVEMTTVQQVAGPQLFWVGPNEEQKLLVYLDEKADLIEKEGVLGFPNKGQKIVLEGELRKPPEAALMVENWKLTPEQASGVAKQDIYLYSKRAELLRK